MFLYILYIYEQQNEFCPKIYNSILIVLNYNSFTDKEKENQKTMRLTENKFFNKLRNVKQNFETIAKNIKQMHFVKGVFTF